MHKLLTRIVRKLNKYKNNLKNKWCHLKNKHDITNDWLESSVLLDCKKINEKEYKLKPKSPIKLSKKDNKNPKKYVEKHQIPEIIVETFSAEHLSESNNKPNAVNNDNKENLERTLHKNLQHNKYGKKDHYKKDKKKNNDKQDFRHSKPDWESKQKKQNNLETMDDEKKDNTQYVMLEHGKTWPTLNVESSKQNNISGDWIMKLADGRAEQRKLNQKNDWIFDRADARKMKRNQMKDDWYFQRAHGRKDCRHNSNSDWC
ncbi:hypothetical protein L9F63_026598 [Diploptera punctata]|uniref:Uncharacterized protein n=1 Tax=Diploptera punctata TaxID=6984 RepID=A0AAD8AH01_DIPPU|nr:hypothetical protein L9F63_026598 [Diploptera punctata]